MVTDAMPYSSTWYQQVISGIPGVDRINVSSPKPGSVELHILLNQDADEEQVCSQLSKEIGADKANHFTCRAILLKPVKDFFLSGMNELNLRS